MAAQTSQEPRPASLRAAYAAAEKQREAIERGAFSFGGSAASSSGSGGRDYGEAVAAALAAYDDCSARIAALALFSGNESAEDVATAHLPYLLVPFRAAELVQRLPPTPGAPPAARRQVLRRARDAYERFLHHLDGYGLLAAPYARLLQAYTEDPEHFSTLGSGTVAGSSSTFTSGRAPGGVAGLVDPAARRNAKIANFQAEKALRSKLDVLRQRQQERREQRRRQRRRIRDQEAAGSGETPEDSDEGEDDDDDDDDDDEAARALYLAQIAYCAHMAFQGLEGLNAEDELLARVPAAAAAAAGGDGTMGGLGDSRHRQGQRPDAAGYSDRIEQQDLAQAAQHLRRLQSAFGSSPTWAGAAGGGPGPLLTKDGKPRQPFTIMGSRAEMAKAVFRPGHNLPTMSIDEYLEEERKRGGIIEGGGPSSGMPAEPDEDNMDKADAETMKARAWDEFTEANHKGSGNTLNRG